MLKKHVSDPEKLQRLLGNLDKCAREGAAIEILNNEKITTKMLASALLEVRPLCEFPIRPDPMLSSGPTPFQEDVMKFQSQVELRDPNTVEFNVVYARLPEKVFTMIKARVTNQRLSGWSG